ncbi:MAG: Ig-like domain-containing protein [Prevotella sp.]|nr:Ig-like domain-containing protein [Prevotella sp.]
MTKKYFRHLACLFLALLGMTQTASAFTNFAVQLTNSDVFDSSVNKFGVKVADDGTYTATAFDDATATFTVNSARFNDPQHGWVNCEFIIPVEGPVKVGLGNCQYGAQDGTITDAAGNVTALTAGNANCWAANNIESTTSYTIYKGLAATTLTIKYNGYCPFISVEAVDASQLVDDATVSFAAGEAAGAQVPASVKLEVGKTFTLPTNFTMYVEGKTLTAWSDGAKEYAPGTEFTVPAQDITLTPVFTANEVSLADRTEPVTVKFDFQRQNGAPTVGWEGKADLVWVAQAEVNGKTIDVATRLSTSPGKFANGNWNDWAQLNNGTKFTIPSCKGAVVSIESYSATTTTTIDGQTDYTANGNVVTYTIANTADNIDVVIGDGSYFRYIQVVLPVVQSAGGQSFDNVAGTIAWAVGNEQNGTISADMANAISSATVSAGDGLKVETASYFDESLAKYTPATSNAGCVADVLIEYRIKAKAGLTFKPTNVSFDAVKVGTDGAYFSYSYTADGVESDPVAVAAADILRNNGANSATAQLRHSVDLSVDAANEFTFRFYISNTANNKNQAIGNIVISGTVNGTVQDVAQYTLATVAAPAEGGSVNVYPAVDIYDEGTTIKLTATENFGYDFVNWTDAEGKEVSTDAVYTFDISKNETLTANFKQVNTYELKLTVDGTNDYMVQVSPAPTMVDGKKMYEDGTSVMLTASSYEGLVAFNNWSNGQTSAELVVSMTDNVDITAYYAEADIIAGWDFFKAGGSGRIADFSAAENEADALNLVNTETGDNSGWLDKSTEAANGYESFKGAAVNWRTGASNGDVGHWHWQTKVNAEAFTDIYVQFQMMYNYNSYQTYNVEYSLNGTDWTGFGSITMEGAKSAASFSGKLPEAANNQKDLFIRMIADKTSSVDGTASANDGNTLAMFFITGTPKLVNDGVAPVLVSTVPAEGATNASATGKVVLTFDEKVKVAEGVKATIAVANGQDGAWQVEPLVSGKTVSFEYKGLEYTTPYKFTLAGNSVADLTDNFKADEIVINFTTMTKPTVTKGAYDFIVPDNGTISQALAAANSRADKTSRFRIFVKNGNYVFDTNGTTTGGDGKTYPDPRSHLTAPNVSFIGESMEGVVITNVTPEATWDNGYGAACPLEGIGNGDVLIIESGANNTYFQNLTIKTSMGDAHGRDIALQDKSNKTVFKDACLWGYQDTYVSNNSNGKFYFEGGVLRGRTDFLCGKGDVYYNQVTLRQVKSGYLAVPSVPKKYGYIFQSCKIVGDTDGVNGNYTLGRPWGSGTPIALFINTEMVVAPSSVGWNEMSGGWPARFAEYNSHLTSGTVVDLSGRKKIFGDNHSNNPVLTAAEAAVYTLATVMGQDDDWDPTLLTEQAPVPQNVKIAGTQLSWDGSNSALLWAVCKDGKVVGFTTEPTYTVDDAAATYTVRAANEMGGLSEASAAAAATDGIETVEAKQTVIGDGAVYNLQGVRVQKAQKGVYIVNGKVVVVK